MSVVTYPIVLDCSASEVNTVVVRNNVLTASSVVALVFILCTSLNKFWS